MYEIVYRSKAVSRFDEKDVKNLLEQARRNNKLHDVTGFLFFDGDFFLQVLEGQKSDVERIFDDISRDSRHCDIEMLWSQNSSPIERRTFPDWSMACAKLHSEAISADLKVDCRESIKIFDDASHGARLFRMLSSMPNLGAQPFMTNTGADIFEPSSSAHLN